MIFRQYPRSVIDILKLKDWQKSMSNISDGEIISINPNPLEKSFSISSTQNSIKEENQNV